MSLLIIIEGPDGVGKSCLTMSLENELRKRNAMTHVSRQPGGTPSSEQIRQLLLDKDYDLTPYTQVLLFLASRMHTSESMLYPLVREDRWVITDRFDYSTRFYQTTLNELEVESLVKDPTEVTRLCTDFSNRVNHLMDEHPIPDDIPSIYIVLDADDDVLNERLGIRNDVQDRFENQPAEFQDRMRRKYRSLRGKANHIFLKTNDSWSNDEIEGLVSAIIDMVDPTDKSQQSIDVSASLEKFADVLADKLIEPTFASKIIRA